MIFITGELGFALYYKFRVGTATDAEVNQLLSLGTDDDTNDDDDSDGGLIMMARMMVTRMMMIVMTMVIR